MRGRRLIAAGLARLFLGAAMVEMRINVTLPDTGALEVGQVYVLADGLEQALVREGLATWAQPRMAPPEVQALGAAPARKRRPAAVEATA